ncbi:hypothetical protein ABPG73_008976 [Tetrahymena malaccensis]
MYQSIRLKLNLSENEINESGISDLCSCLSNCTSLSNLSLELVYLDIGHKCLTILSSLFQKLKNLSYLSINLNRNNIGVQEVTVLSSVIGKCSNLKALEFILHIFGEGVGPPLQGVGFKKAKGIPCTNKVINKYYELSDTPKNNKIGQEGISELISCMNKCSNLRILTLRLDFENFGVEVFPIITSRLGQLKNLTNLTIKEFLLFPLGCKTQSCQTCDFFKIQKLVQVNIIQVDATNIMQKYYLICKRQERLLETLCEQEQNDNEFTSAKLNVLHFNKTLSQLQQSKLKNALLCDKKTKLKKFWQIQSSKRNQMNQQLLGGSENYSKLKNPLDHQQQLRDDEQDSFNYQQTIQKKQHDKQEVLSKVNKKIESIKIEKDQDETQQGIENDLNLLIQILYDKHQEIVISDQSIEIKKEISKGEQKIEQLQNSTNIQQIYMASKSSDYVSECASNQYSIPQFEQKGVQRFQSTKENLISLEQNKKNKLNKAQQNLKLNCEQFLREIFQLGDHLNSGGEADIFIHKNDESIAYRSDDISPILLDFYSKLKKQDQNQEPKMIYKLMIKLIRYLKKQNCYDQSLFNLIKFIQEDKINQNSVYQQKLLKEMVTKIQEISQLPFQEYHLYNKLNYNRKYFDTDDQNQYQFFSENANGKKEQQIIQSINLISKVIFQYLENDTISEKKNSNVGQLNFITYFDCKKISLKFIGSEELFNKTFKSFSSQLYFGNIILHNLSTKHRKEEVLKEITTLNVEMQNRQFSQYSLENEKTLNLSLKKIYNLTQINMPCFTFFISKLTNITTLKLQLKQYLNETININNEVNSVLLNIDLFINALPLQNITHLTLDNGQNFIGNEITQCVVSIVENCQCLTDLNLELSANFINDDGVYTIATSLILCQNIVKLSLNLSLNNISIDGAVSLTTALENNFSIKQLNINLSGNQIGNEVAQCVVNIIQTSESLTNLSVGLDINSINDEGVQIIANALNNCKNITEFQIGLKQNYINLKGASILLKALENSQQFKIASFDLSENYIEEEELKKLIKAFIINREEFKSQQNEISNQISDITSKDLDQLIQIDQSREYNLLMEQHSLITNNPQVNLDENLTTNQINLNSSSDQISDTNLFNITKELKNITLSDFYINWKNVFISIAKNIDQYLDQNKFKEFNLNLILQQSTSENLCFNNFEEINKQIYLHTDILSQCKNVNQLDINLEENKINAEGVSTLAKALERCDKITNLYLNLKRNQIDDQGFNNAMGIMFKNKNISIFNINFNCCNIGANNSLVVSNNFEQCQNIIELTLKLKLNLIGIEAAKNIANVLKKCQNLTKLNINLARNYQIKPSKDNFGDDEIEIIANSLLDYQNLTELSLNSSANNISCSGAKSIAVALGHCRNLKILNLDISNNKITSEGKQFIADSLEKCQNINKLNLSLGNNSQVDIINNNEPNIIADTLQNIENITELSLDFQFNDIDINGNKILVTALENNQNIRSLELNLDRGKVHFK